MHGTEESPIVIKSDDSASNPNWSGIYLMSNNENTEKTVLEDFTVDQIGSKLVTALTYGKGASAVPSSHSLRCVVVDGAGGNSSDLNSITFGAATYPVAEKIMVLNGKDDGIECFGGQLTLEEVSVSNVLDDAIDADQGAQVLLLGALLLRGENSDNFIETGGSVGLQRTLVIGTDVKSNGLDKVQTKDASDVMINGYAGKKSLTKLGKYELSDFGVITKCVNQHSEN